MTLKSSGPTLAGLFASDPKTIAESLASREAFPQGPASGMRVLSFYISHAGRGLSPSRRRSLEKAKEILSARVKQELKELNERRSAA